MVGIFFLGFTLLQIVVTIGASSVESAEWEKIVEAAKREGQVTIYMSGWEEVLSAGVFQRAYGDIKVVSVVLGVGGNVVQRVLAERRAGKYLVDVIMEGTTSIASFLTAAKALDPLRPAMVLPEVLDESKWWQGRHSYADREGQYVLKYVGTPGGGGYYNVNLVNPREFKSFWDFVNPKWKGKIVSRDPRVPGPARTQLRFWYHNPEIGPNYIRQMFGEMDITLSQDWRQPTDWLAKGKFLLCLSCQDIEKGKGQGLPVDSFGPMKEGAGLSSQFGGLALPNKAPHPNAAKVFINWLLSREGQITLQKALAKSGSSAPDSLRIDIPKDDVLPESRRLEGVKYLDVDTPERTDMRPILKVLEEALAKVKK